MWDFLQWDDIDSNNLLLMMIDDGYLRLQTDGIRMVINGL